MQRIEKFFGRPIIRNLPGKTSGLIQKAFLAAGRQKKKLNASQKAPRPRPCGRGFKIGAKERQRREIGEKEIDQR
jgi:hypothetical protein